MTNDELYTIAETYGTPTYVFDTEAFGRRLEAVRDIFGEKVALCYSIKANPFLIPSALACGLKLEVCSPGELDICKHEGVDPKKIVYSGVCKGVADVREALELSAGVFTAESPNQFELVNREAVAAGRRVPVLLRLNGGSQFGMSRADLIDIVDRRDEFEGCELVGIHYFVGTQRTKLKHQRKELQMLTKLIDELEREHGWKVERLEYGPGLAVPLFEGQDFSDTLAPAREIAADLAALTNRVELTVEMGRFFATECGYYLTHIVDQKSNEGTNYCFIDGGMNHVTYLGQMMGLKQPRILNLSRERRHAEDVTTAGETKTIALCGSLCTTSDVLVREAEVVDLRMGDVLAFENIGAYSITEGIYLFLSRTMPRVVLRNADGCTLTRDFVESWQLNVAQ